MRIPKKILIVGTVEEITYQKDKARSPVTINFSAKNKDYLLATNSTYTALYIFESNTTGKVTIIKDKKGLQSGFLHQVIKYEIPNIELKKHGAALTIRYCSTWWEGEMKEYRHDFKDAIFFTESYSRFKTMGIKPKKGKIIGADGIR